MNSKQLLISLARSDWSDLKVSCHQISKELATRGFDVLYVNTALHPSLFLRRLSKAKEKLIEIFKNGEMIAPYFRYHTPFYFIPYGKIKHFQWSVQANRYNNYLMSLFLKQKIKDYQIIDKPILLLWSPFWVDMIDFIPHKLAIYHCGDEYSAMPGFASITRYVDDKTMEKANIVFTTADNLYRRAKSLNPSTYLLPNGVDFELFSKALYPETQIPEDLMNIPGPRVGFIGSISKWVDIDLIHYLAQRLKELNFVLIGPVKTDVSKLSNLQNLYLLGRKKQEELPNYLKAIDVCLIPFKVNELTHAVNPLKLHEYLAAGKPVVATELSELNKYREFIRLSNSREDFEANILLALQERGEYFIAQRVAFAKENSWSNRVDSMLEQISRRLKGIS